MQRHANASSSRCIRPFAFARVRRTNKYLILVGNLRNRGGAYALLNMQRQL